jgi:transposase
MLAEHLALIDTLDEAISRTSQEITQRLDPPPDPSKVNAPTAEQDQEQEQAAQPEAFEGTDQGQEQDASSLSWAQVIVLLCSIPGISRRAAEGILAEIGLEMSRFPTSRHLASWAGMCPGNHESAGKRLSGRTTKGSPWLRKLLVEAAHAAAHTKNTYLSALYRRIKARGGAKQAMIAVGHAILIICYHLLDRQVCCEELGGNSFDEHDRQATEKRLVRRLEQLCYHVELQEVAQVA